METLAGKAGIVARSNAKEAEMEVRALVSRFFEDRKKTAYQDLHICSESFELPLDVRTLKFPLVIEFFFLKIMLHVYRLTEVNHEVLTVQYCITCSSVESDNSFEQLDRSESFYIIFFFVVVKLSAKPLYSFIQWLSTEESVFELSYAPGSSDTIDSESTVLFSENSSTSFVSNRQTSVRLKFWYRNADSYLNKREEMMIKIQ